IAANPQSMIGELKKLGRVETGLQPTGYRRILMRMEIDSLSPKSLTMLFASLKVYFSALEEKPRPIALQLPSEALSPSRTPLIGKANHGNP
ncbi:hypothetical protein U1Q18_031496, partial [Sarracenia purpurea var. burkii]